MLPNPITMTANVTHDAEIQIELRIPPQHAALALTIAKAIEAAANKSIKQHTYNLAQKKKELAAHKTQTTTTKTRQRIKLSVTRRATPQATAKAYKCKVAEIKTILRMANKKERDMLKLQRLKIILKLDHKGVCHTEIGKRVGLHQKSVTRLINQNKQTAMF